MTDTVDSFSAMLRAALGDSLDPADSYLAMLADDAIMECPYAPPGLPNQVEGQTAVGDYLAAIAKLLDFERIARRIVHRTNATFLEREKLRFQDSRNRVEH